MCPVEMSGQNTLAWGQKMLELWHTIRAGKMLKKATMPFGVDAGTRSCAADRMTTYRTGVRSVVAAALPLFSNPKIRNAVKSLLRAPVGAAMGSSLSAVSHGTSSARTDEGSLLFCFKNGLVNAASHVERMQGE